MNIRIISLVAVVGITLLAAAPSERSMDNMGSTNADGSSGEIHVSVDRPESIGDLGDLEADLELATVAIEVAAFWAASPDEVDSDLLKTYLESLHQSVKMRSEGLKYRYEMCPTGEVKQVCYECNVLEVYDTGPVPVLVHVEQVFVL